MSNDLEIFLQQAGKIAEAQEHGIKSGKKLGTWQDIGVFFPPGTKSSIVNARVVEILSPDAWQQKANDVLKNLPSVDISKPTQPKPTFPNVTIDRS